MNRHGLRQITMHDFRRMYTVVMISHGASVKEVQEQLGHGDVRTTLKHYDRVLKSRKKETANKMDVFRQTMNKVGL